MNRSSLLPLFSLLLLLSWTARVSAQGVDASGTDAPPPGSTVITSDELRSDQANHTSVFTGNVVVVGSSFNLNCQEMTVLFTKDGKVDHIIATGNVVITQPNRVAHCGQADYYRDEDKFVLTDSPIIVDNKNQIEAPIITIFRTKQTMITSGARSKVTLKNDSISSDTTAAPVGTP